MSRKISIRINKKNKKKIIYLSTLLYGLILNYITTKINGEKTDMDDISWKIKPYPIFFYINEIIQLFLKLFFIFNSNNSVFFSKVIYSILLTHTTRFLLLQITVLPPLKNYQPVEYKYFNSANQIESNQYIFSGHIINLYIISYFYLKKKNITYLISIIGTMITALSRQHYGIDGINSILLCYFIIKSFKIDSKKNKIYRIIK